MSINCGRMRLLAQDVLGQLQHRPPSQAFAIRSCFRIRSNSTALCPAMLGPAEIIRRLLPEKLHHQVSEPLHLCSFRLHLRSFPLLCGDIHGAKSVTYLSRADSHALLFHMIDFEVARAILINGGLPCLGCYRLGRWHGLRVD